MSQRESNRREQQRELSIRRWVSDKTLADYYEVSRCTIWRWAKMGRLPAPEEIGPNCTRWDFQKIKESEAA